MIELKGEITVFSIVGCPFCIRAKGKLEGMGLAFLDINLDKFKGARQLMVEKTGKKTVPQIFFNSKHIGGWSDFNGLVSHLNIYNLFDFFYIWVRIFFILFFRLSSKGREGR